MPDLGTTTSSCASEEEKTSTDDFMSSDNWDELHDEAEPIERYQQGLYYPIYIGELLNQRYRVEYKLGHGGFSTVWMAYDLQKKKDVALKIMIPGDAGEREYRIQTEIVQAVPDISILLTHEATFTLRGSQGDHRVLVLPLRGPNLRSHLRQASVASRMTVAGQLLKAFANLHKCQIVHRDLNNGNVLWGINTYDTNTKHDLLGQPQKIPLTTWKQGELVKPVEIPQNLINEETACLCDFGMAIKAGTSVKTKWQSPAFYCAPERFHNADPSLASDMWSYMCIFAELYLGFCPFYDAYHSSLMANLVYVIGPLPEQWKGLFNGAGTSDDSWYDSTRKPVPSMTLSAMIERMRPETGPTERKLVLSVMSKGFRYVPEQRLTAAELLQDPSFTALMDMYRC